MRRPPPAGRVVAALLAAAAVLPMRSAVAAEAPLASEPVSPRSTARVHACATLPDSASADVEDHASRAVFVLPDEAWDARRAWPYLDRLSSLGVTVVELRTDDDRPLGSAEARAAIAAAGDELGLRPSRVALLGFGAGGRLALALAGPDRPAAALYPGCDGAPAPAPGARVMVLHPDEASEARACAALVGGRPGARSDRPSAGAGHGWDAVGERGAGPTLLPHPGDADARARRVAAHPDRGATARAARAVSGFFLGGLAGYGGEGDGP